MKSKDSREELKKGIINRLNRVEGQIRGIKAMIEEDKYCLDVLNQIWAARSALGKTGELLVEGHVKQCLKEDETKLVTDIDELIKALKALMN